MIGLAGRGPALFFVWILGLLTIGFSSCKDDDPPSPTGEADFTINSGVVLPELRFENRVFFYRGKVKLSGKLPEVLERGVVYSLETNPARASLTFRPLTRVLTDSTFEVEISNLNWRQSWFFRTYTITRNAEQKTDTTYSSNYALQALHRAPALGFSNPLPNQMGVSYPGVVLNTMAGLREVLAKGFCWSEAPLPIPGQGNTQFIQSNDSIGFSTTVTGLKPATVYFFRPFVVNRIDTAFGPVQRFSTAFADLEGNVYETVPIGNRLWMKENLRSTVFSNGSPIPTLSGESWATTSGPASDWIQADRAVLGRYYNGLVLADPANVCPVDWQLPTQADWDTLFRENGGWQQAGLRMKAARSEWGPSIPADQGISGFQAFPTGWRQADGNNRQTDSFAYWWTWQPNTPPYAAIRINNLDTEAFRHTTQDPKSGFAIRCIKKR